ncbi:hypothetical protein Tco_0573322 [Tanacetum coccineum]
MIPYVKQFWQTATVRTIANGNQELLSTIDSKAYTITKAFVRSSLQLVDATGITNLPDAKIHKGLATMRGFEGNHVPLLPAMLAPAQGEGSTIPAGSQPTPTDPTLTPVADEATTTIESKRKAENSSKQGRKSQDDRSEDFITPLNSREAQEQDISPTLLDAAKTLKWVASGDVSTYKRRRRSVDTGTDYFNTAKERTKFEEVNTGSTKVNTGSTPDNAQRKEKAKIVEENEDWDVIRAKLEANVELVKNMQGEGLSEEDFAKRMVDMINQRKKYFTEERAKAKRSKPITQTQLRTYMSNYLKNQEQWKLSHLTNEELQTRTSKKQKTVDDSGFAELQEKVAAKDVPVTEEKTRETRVPKEEEEDSETDKEEDMEAIGAILVTTESPKRKYLLSSDACQAMLDIKLQGGKQNEECYQLLKLIEKQEDATLKIMVFERILSSSEDQSKKLDD